MSAVRVRIRSAALYFLPIETRIPLRFGAESLTRVCCARVSLDVESARGRATGWGETPLSAQWAWPSELPVSEREAALQGLCGALARSWTSLDAAGHPIELGHLFVERELPLLLRDFNSGRPEREPVPHLAALMCASPFDIALHDAYATLFGVPVYETYAEPFLCSDLSSLVTPALAGRRLDEFLVPPSAALRAWHLVGGSDALDDSDAAWEEPDGHPATLVEWIRRDGLKNVKVKLRGTDFDWDFGRLVRVGELGRPLGVEHIGADFNGTVREPGYVEEILKKLELERAAIYEALRYVEQPFPHDLEALSLDAGPIAKRKPVLLDESALDWRSLELGLSLGWTGVVLKTCKTQTESLLTMCWAKRNHMRIMVQDLTNPMLAQISHVQLAAHVAPWAGVETNSMQFYPDASRAEAAVHPGLFRRIGGDLDLSSIRGPGFGYRLDEVGRALPAPALVLGS